MSSAGTLTAASQKAAVHVAETPRSWPGPAPHSTASAMAHKAVRNALAGREASCVLFALVSATASMATSRQVQRQVNPAFDCQPGGPRWWPKSRPNCTATQGCVVATAVAAALASSTRRQKAPSGAGRRGGRGVGANASMRQP